MLDAVPTVRACEPNSHQGEGREIFADTHISRVNEKDAPVVFVRWGAYAQKKTALIDTDKHTIIKSAHPSPLSARAGFFGGRPFSAINRALRNLVKPKLVGSFPTSDHLPLRRPELGG